MGTGTVGKEREGYFAGWKLIGDMLDEGRSFSALARVKEDDMAGVLERYI